MPPELHIPAALLDGIRAHAEATFPAECCGILLGAREEDALRVSEALRARNLRQDSSQDRYEIAPEELVAAQKKARENGGEIVGFYHSHPGHPAQWSKRDLAEAHWLGCSYLIVSVIQGQAAEVRSFRLAGTGESDKSFLEERLVLD